MLSTITHSSNILLCTAGGTSIAVAGSNFGLNPSVTVGGAACSVTYFTHVLIQCTTPTGSGASSVQVTANTQLSNADRMFSYNGNPSITSFSPAAGPTTGGTQITVLGAQFAGSPTDPTVSVGSFACNVSSFNDTQIVCTLTAGEGINLAVTVISFGNVLTFAPTFSFNAPVLSGITPSNGSTSGVDILTVSGSNFGLNPSVTVAGQTCNRLFSNHTSIQCQVPAGQGLS